MEVKFIEVTEEVRNEANELVEATVLKIIKDCGTHAVGNRATDKDKLEYAKEYADFLKAKELAGFDEFLAKKRADLEAEFLASKEA